MAGDVLPTLLAMVVAELGDQIPADMLARIEANIRASHGGEDHYIARRSKGALLSKLEAMEQQGGHAQSTDMLAKALGVSPRRVQQLNQLRGRRRG
jgi:transcriptional regulator GlxA family with amidase domain